MTLEHQTALAELSGVLDHIDADSLDTACLALTKERSIICLLYTSPSPRDRQKSRMPSSA